MRRFGLEVEFGGSISGVIAALNAAGIPVADMSRTHLGHSDTAWTVKRDGSLNVIRGGGGELVSPPLDFDDPDAKEQVYAALGALQAAGCQPHQAAGIHVHIEALHEDGRRMSAREIAAIVRFTYKFEDAIYRIASSGWRRIRPGSTTYATPIPEETAQAIMKVQTDEELRNVWRGNTVGGRRTRNRLGARSLRSLDRYTATNLQSYFMRNTVEFRYFNSSINPRRVWTYIAFCMAIKQDACNGFSRSVKKSYRVGAMLAGDVTEKALLLRLQQVLTTDSRDTKRCMSKEDWKNFRTLLWATSVPQACIWYGGRYYDRSANVAS